MALATLTIDLVAKLASLERDMGKAAQIAEKNAKRMDEAFARVKTSLAAIGSVLTVGAFAGMVRSVADAGDQLQKLSTKTGATVEELSKLQYAASLSDLSNEDLGASLVKLNKVMGEAADGSKTATEALARFGIAPESGFSTVEALRQIADKVKATGDETKVASALNDVFGKSFASLIPLLKGGSEGMKESADELERMGGVMSGELAEASEKFNDNLTKIGTSLEALEVRSMGPVVEGLESLTTKFNEAAKAAGGFWAGLATWATTGGDQESNPAAAIVAITKKLNTLKETKAGLEAPTLANKLGLNTEDIAIVNTQMDALAKQLKYLQNLNTASVGNVKDSWLSKGPSFDGIADAIQGTPKPKAGGGTKAEKFDTSIFDAGIKAEESYLKAMEAIAAAQETARRSTLGLTDAQSKLLDLKQSDTWGTLSAEQQKAAEDQAKYADETINAAEAQERLNALIGGLDSTQIEKAWEDAELLNQALDRGAISQSQYSEAINKLFGDSSKQIDEQKDLAKDLGMTFSSAFEDAIVKGEEFSDVLNGIYEDILRILVRKNITEPLANSFGSIDFGSLLNFNADGGVYSSPSLSAYSGGVYSSPQLFKFANGAGVFGEAGPEAIMPLSRTSDGKLGVKAQGTGNVSITINNSVSDQAEITAQPRMNNGQLEIEVLVQKALAKDMSRNGPITQGLAQTFGMARAV